MWDVPSMDGLKACPCSCLPLPRPGLPAVRVRLRQAHTAPLPGRVQLVQPPTPLPTLPLRQVCGDSAAVNFSAWAAVGDG